MLPPSKFSGNIILKNSVVSEGCIIHAQELERCIIGNRSRIGKGTVMKNCVTFGNDYYENMHDLAHPRHGIQMGIGENCHLENCIVDKDVRIGDHVEIIGGPQMEETETENYCIKDGIVIMKKGAVLESHTRVI
jgi:glucose-1-phosphate adenylyltransferase